MARYGMDFNRGNWNRGMEYDNDFGWRGGYGASNRDWDRNWDADGGYGEGGWGFGEGRGGGMHGMSRGEWGGMGRDWNAGGMNQDWHSGGMNRDWHSGGMNRDWNAGGMNRGERGGMSRDWNAGRGGNWSGTRHFVPDQSHRVWGANQGGGYDQDMGDRMRSGWGRMGRGMRNMMGDGYDRGW